PRVSRTARTANAIVAASEASQPKPGASGRWPERAARLAAKSGMETRSPAAAPKPRPLRMPCTMSMSEASPHTGRDRRPPIEVPWYCKAARRRPGFRRGALPGAGVEIVGERRQHLGAVGGEDVEVFEADAVAVGGVVEAGLQGEHVARREHPLGSRRLAEDR